MRSVDLRSDLLTRPTPEMRAAMEAACARPWSFELREDPDQRALEAELAALLGHEDALVMPSSTMANEIALLLLTRPGDVVIAPAETHIVTSEAGAPAALAGVRVECLAAFEPPEAAWAQAAAARPDALRARVAAFALENTHNRAGGAAIAPAATDAILAIARAQGIAVHLDGARIFNAAIALDVPIARLTRGFDTVTVSLNKGLGAPLGAALVSSRGHIAGALALRQRLGGGIRPTAIFAAAARVALGAWREVAQDHRRAAILADGLAAIPGVAIQRPATPTNIVLVEFDAREPAELCVALAAEGVQAIPFGVRRVRFVTYRGIDDDDIAHTIAACRRVAASRAQS